MDNSHWNLCEDGWVKLSICSYCRNGQQGAGGLIRDSEGLFVLGYAKDAGTSSPLMAELVALHEGLKLVKSRNFTNVVVETEHIEEDKLLKDEYSSSSEFAEIIQACKEMIVEGDATTEFTQVPTASRAAIFFSSRGSLDKQLKVFEEIPDDNMTKALALDFLGKQYTVKKEDWKAIKEVDKRWLEV